MADPEPGSSHEESEVVFDVDPGAKTCKVLRINCQNNVFVPKNTTLFSYSLDSAKKMFKSRQAGVMRLNAEVARVGRELKKGDLVGWIGGQCPHDMVYQGACVNCHMVLERKENAGGDYVSMVHDKPDLMRATQIAEDSRKALLESKKLILMVDLDQTLVHTTNKPPDMAEAQFDLKTYTIQNLAYYTKVRPHTFEFLDAMSKLFEMHVCTYGKREYAVKVLEQLDGNKYFAERILTRDELLSQSDKSKNLGSLFPAGEQMVLMVDDRCDVWGFSKALIWIKPYLFFKNIGDINDPSMFKRPEKEKNGAENGKEEQKAKDGTEGEDPNASVEEEQKQKEADEAAEEHDHILNHIADALTRIHHRFYECYERDGKIPRASELAGEVRAGVLKGELVVFSGLPKHPDGRRHQLVDCAEDFGAQVQDQVDDRTTVLVALRTHTEKYCEARRRALPVVNPKWLEDSAAHWKNMPKKDYTELMILAPPRAPLLVEPEEVTTLGRSALQSMVAEVDECLADSDDEEDGEGNNSDQEDAPAAEANGRKRRLSGDSTDESEQGAPAKKPSLEAEEEREEEERKEQWDGEQEPNSSADVSEDGMAADLESMLRE